MKRLISICVLSAVCGVFAADRIKLGTEWQGVYQNSRIVTTAALRDLPHNTMEGVAVDLSRILAAVPPHAQGVTVEWVKDVHGEAGQFRVTYWNEKKEQIEL